ncbi:STE20-related kinase adapter protein stlk isoform X2 [Drosophila suzukii]|uniref:STE20-related kinase adapter protein stlk isoform X2 n=1 Tax=Drosophila suzukii TaxID=28584 RepID=A0ABM4TWR9_DROSZ|nr:putative serine/threonine-protein kinase STE20-like isoform X2 [Drosophila suzukii]
MCSNNIHHYKLLQILKYGRYGTVYKGYDFNNKCLAIKKLSLDQPIEELTAMCFPEIIIALIIKDVLSAITYIHSENCVHGSIRAQHILINSRKAVISNFRDCQTFINHGEKKKVLYGSTVGKKNQLYWKAPEVLNQNLSGYTEKTDIYSTGITCCEMANGFQPYQGTELTYMYIEKARGSRPLLLDQSSILEDQESSLLPETNEQFRRDIFMKKSFSDDFHQFVELCLNKNPLSRWAASKLMTHSFLKQCRCTSLAEHFKDFNHDLSKCKLKERAGVFYECLQFINDDEIKEAIPPIGLRVLFRVMLTVWKKAKIEIDFDFLYQGKTNLLFDRWNSLKDKILIYFKWHIHNEDCKRQLLDVERAIVGLLAPYFA